MSHRHSAMKTWAALYEWKRLNLIRIQTPPSGFSVPGNDITVSAPAELKP